MAEERPNIRPSDQLLPGALGSMTQDPLVNERMDSLPISDVFSIPLTDIPVDGMQNPVNERMFDAARRANQFIIPQTFTSGTRNDSTTGFDMSDPMASVRRNNVSLQPNEPLPEIPRYFSAADTGFDRYYSHPKFTELGFTPYNPNTEQIYNNNSSLGDDRSRMWGEFTGLFGNAFMSGYRAIGDLFTGEYGDPDF